MRAQLGELAPSWEAAKGSTKIKEGNPIQTASGTRSRWTIASDHKVSRRDRKRWSMKRLTTAVSNAPGPA